MTGTAGRLDVDELLAVAGISRPAFMARGACRGHDPRPFFPGRTGAARTILAEARAVCASCPVADECREYAIAEGIKFGIWGGTSERQRRQIRRDRRESAA